MESRRSPSPAAAVLFAAPLLSSAVTGTPAMGTIATKTTRRSKRKDPKVRTEKTNDNLVNVNNVTIAEAVEDVSNQGELTRTTSGGEGSGNLKTSAGGIWRNTIRPYLVNTVRKRKTDPDVNDGLPSKKVCSGGDSVEKKKKCTFCSKSFTQTDPARHDRRRCPENPNRIPDKVPKGKRKCTECGEEGHLAKSHCRTCKGLYNCIADCAERFTSDLHLCGPAAVLGYWFITITLSGLDVPASFLLQVTKAGVTAMRRRLDFLNPGNTMPLKIQTKPVEDSSFIHILGYILKDRGQASFRIMKDDTTTEDELASAQLKYGSKKKLFGNATATLTKSNFMFEVSRFALRMCPELVGIAGVIDMLYFMLFSGVYCLAIGWIAGSNGFVISRERTAAFMRLSMHGPERVQKKDIEMVVFGRADTNARLHGNVVDPWVQNPQISNMTLSQARNLVLGDEAMAAGVAPPGMEFAEARSSSPALDGSEAMPAYLSLTPPLLEETSPSDTASDNEKEIEGEFDNFIDDSEMSPVETQHGTEATEMLAEWKAGNGPTGAATPAYWIDKNHGLSGDRAEGERTGGSADCEESEDEEEGGDEEEVVGEFDDFIDDSD
eukprot:gene19047-7626_t